MIDKHELMIGSMVLYSDQFGDHEGIISSLGVDTCQIEGHGAYFAYEGLKPIILDDDFMSHRLGFLIFSSKGDGMIFYHRNMGVQFAFQKYVDYHCIFLSKRDDFMQLHKLQKAIEGFTLKRLEIMEKLPSI